MASVSYKRTATRTIVFVLHLAGSALGIVMLAVTLSLLFSGINRHIVAATADNAPAAASPVIADDHGVPVEQMAAGEPDKTAADELPLTASSLQPVREERPPAPVVSALDRLTRALQGGVEKPRL